MPNASAANPAVSYRRWQLLVRVHGHNPFHEAVPREAPLVPDTAPGQGALPGQSLDRPRRELQERGSLNCSEHLGQRRALRLALPGVMVLIHVFYSRRPALAGIIGARRPWTALMISSLSIP
jgi:hypothetical protein